MWLLFTSGTIEGFQNIHFIFVLAGGQTTLSSNDANLKRCQYLFGTLIWPIGN